MKITFNQIKLIIDELIPKSLLFKMPQASQVIELCFLLNQMKKDDLSIEISLNKVEIKYTNNTSFTILEFKKLIEKPLIESYFLSKTIQKILNQKRLHFLSKNKHIDKNSFLLIQNNKTKLIKV